MDVERCLVEGSKIDSNLYHYCLDPEKSFWIKIDGNLFFSLPFKQQNLISRGIVHAVGLTESGELSEFDLLFDNKRDLMFGFKKINTFLKNPDTTPSVHCKSEALAKLEQSLGYECAIIGPSKLLPY